MQPLRPPPPARDAATPRACRRLCRAATPPGRLQGPPDPLQYVDRCRPMRLPERLSRARAAHQSETVTSATAPTWAGPACRPVGLGGQGAQRPVTVAGEEPEVTGGRGRHLGGELTGAVEEPDVGVAHRRSPPDHGPGSPPPWRRRCRRGTGRPPWRRTSGVTLAASSPRATGTPTREPYSVQEPS